MQACIHLMLFLPAAAIIIPRSRVHSYQDDNHAIINQPLWSRSQTDWDTLMAPKLVLRDNLTTEQRMQRAIDRYRQRQRAEQQTPQTVQVNRAPTPNHEHNPDEPDLTQEAPPPYQDHYRDRVYTSDETGHQAGHQAHPQAGHQADRSAGPHTGYQADHQTAHQDDVSGHESQQEQAPPSYEASQENRDTNRSLQ